MSHWWNKPVTVETIKVGQRMSITSVERAAEFMLHEWPSEVRGAAYDAATGALVNAYDGKLDPEDARRAFLAALVESGVYIFDE